VFHYVLETTDTCFAIVNIVENAVVASIAWGYATQGASIDTISEASSTSLGGFSGVTEFALMADGGAKSPTTGLLIELGKTACFIGSPAVVALGSSAGCL